MLGSDRFMFEPLLEADIPLLHEWLNRPHVAEHWDGSCSLEQVKHRYLSHVGNANVSPYMVHFTGIPFGFIQAYWATRVGDGWWSDVKDPGTIGIDYFIANPTDIGQGLGTRMIRDFLHKVFENPAVTNIISDPAPDNRRSIRCLEKVGFIRIGLVDTPDGKSVLMKLERALHK